METAPDTAVVERLTSRLVAALKLDRWHAGRRYPNSVRDLESTVRFLQRTIDVSEDARAFLTGYAHVFQEPRPNIAQLARAQGITPAGVRRRYSEEIVDLIRALISGDATVSQMERALPSVPLGLLYGVSPSLDRELRGLRVERINTALVDVDLGRPFYVDIEPMVATVTPVPEEEVEAGRHLVNPAASLLGIVSQLLGESLTAGGHFQVWSNGAVQSKVEWAGGLQVSQAVAALVPYYAEYPKRPENVVTGIHGLRLDRMSEHSAALTWTVAEGHVRLFLDRLADPALQL